MIKFFRKIRQNILTDGKSGNSSFPSSRYLKYAIGEILLVVIGILIALQINTWNENRIAYNRSEIYLEEILKDLITDTLAINRSIGFSNEYLNNELWVLNKTEFNSHDSNSLWKAIGGFYSSVPLNNRTFQKIQNAGESKLVGFDSVYDKVSVYYTKTHDWYNQFAEWDRKMILDGQSYMKDLDNELEMSNYRVQLLGRETTTQKFPTIQDSSEQIKRLIDFAMSPRGRNHFKYNYARHARCITLFEGVKSEVIDLIAEIKQVLND